MTTTKTKGSTTRTKASALLLGLFVVAMAAAAAPSPAEAQDAAGGSKKGRAAQEIFLDDEELDVEADLPSVDLVLTFKGLRYESIAPKTSFFPELLETVESAPF